MRRLGFRVWVGFLFLATVTRASLLDAPVTAWCIVPYDAAQRGPVERARMLRELGITQFAYDYREQHVPTFDDEIAAVRQHGITLVAWWFPTELDDTARHILATLERHQLHLQLWVSGWDTPASRAMDSGARLEHEVRRIQPIATAAAAIGCSVALYNHGGWFGEPENQVAIIEALRAAGVHNVGIVYNFHHGHAHLDRFAELWLLMQPYTVAVNINGMVAGGDARGQKILYVGEGDRELELIRIIHRSGWTGPIGLLNHREDVDAAAALRRNLDGWKQLCEQLRTEQRGGNDSAAR